MTTRHPILLPALGLAPFGALVLLGCSGETDLYQTTSRILAEHVGQSCEIDGYDGPDPNRVDLQLGNPACGNGYCIAHSDETEVEMYCTCRCDAPNPNAPLCTCPSGFSCEHVIDDLGFGDQSQHFVGSYCVKAGWTHLLGR